MKLKRKFAFVLSGLFLISTTIGCGEKDSDADPIDEPTTENRKDLLYPTL
jgi:hypothetical protein